MQVVAGPSGLSIARELCQELDLPLVEPEYKIFPDGESYLRVPGELGNEVLVIQSCYYPQDTNLFQLLNLVATVKRMGVDHVKVFVPYMCYARADRAVKPGEAVSIQTVLTTMEAVGVDHLITLDLHNPEVLETATFNTTNIFASLSMKRHLEEQLPTLDNLQVVAPDQGATKRAEDLAKLLDVPCTALEKYRNPDTGNVSLQLGDAEIVSESLVIVDDIISTGGTLMEASNLLRINGANQIHYLITHALGTDAVDKLKEIGNGLVSATNSTNSIIGTISPIEDLKQVI